MHADIRDEPQPMTKPTRRAARGARTLPREYFVSPEVFERETRSIFREQWLCVGRTSQLPEAGSHFLADVEGESLLVVRDDAGQLRCFFNVCRHRGTRLCVQPRAEPIRSIRCPYHAWTYDLAGTLVAAPNMREVEGFTCADYPLKPVAVAEWQGFVMVNLSQAPRPVEEWTAPLGDRLQAWRIEHLVPAEGKQLAR